MRQHLAVLRSTLRRLLATPMASALNILIMGIAISLPVGLYVLLQNVQEASAHVSGAPQISVFVALNAGKDETAQIGRRLAQHPGIARAEFVPRDQALQQLKRNSGLADVIDGVGHHAVDRLQGGHGLAADGDRAFQVGGLQRSDGVKRHSPAVFPDFR